MRENLIVCLMGGLVVFGVADTCTAQMPVFEQVMGDYLEALEVVQNIDDYYLTDPTASPVDHLRWVVFDRPKAMSNLVSSFAWLQMAAIIPPAQPTHRQYIGNAHVLVWIARDICRPHGF